jgi:predicted Zn-dependent protease
MGIIDNLREMLAAGQDNALLRYTLGQALLNQGDVPEAVEHLRRAIALDPGYTAAWKVYGKALQAADDRDGAIQAYETGIETAARNGDIQAAKEMKVFLKRLRK